MEHENVKDYEESKQGMGWVNLCTEIYKGVLSLEQDLELIINDMKKEPELLEAQVQEACDIVNEIETRKKLMDYIRYLK